MNRRFFLAALAGATLDPERLLWVPGKKLISIPKASAEPDYAVMYRTYVRGHWTGLIRIETMTEAQFQRQFPGRSLPPRRAAAPADLVAAAVGAYRAPAHVIKDDAGFEKVAEAAFCGSTISTPWSL